MLNLPVDHALQDSFLLELAQRIVPFAHQESMLHISTQQFACHATMVIINLPLDNLHARGVIQIRQLDILHPLVFLTVFARKDITESLMKQVHVFRVLQQTLE
jgi:hypothetical protein